jgi:hypothetical protein
MTLLFVLIIAPISAQTVLTISPVISMQNAYSRLDKNIDTPYFSQAYTWFPNYSIGLLVDVRIDDKYRLTTGIIHGSFGLNYKITKEYNREQADTLFPPEPFPDVTKTESKVSIEDDLVRFPFLIGYKLGHIKFKSPRKQYSPFGISVEGRAGFSLDYIFQSPPGFLGGSGFGAYHRDTVSALRTLNLSLYLGFALQLKHHNKDRLRAEVFFSQGVRDIGENNVTYSVLGDPNTYKARVKTRGTVIGLNLSYPIRIAGFQHKKQGQIINQE